MTVPAALGFAAHSGWAVVVGVSLTGGRPHVLVRERIELMDPRDLPSKQPYHTVESMPIRDAAARLAEYAATAERLAGEALRRMLDHLARLGCQAVGFGIVDSSGRKGASLAAILGSHALIHTADGDHFRDALARAAAQMTVPVVRVRARDLDERAETGTGIPIAELRLALKDAGHEIGPPWTADHKAAALLAWLLLHEIDARPDATPV